MAAGYELTSSHPSEKNYKDVENKPLVSDVLKFIFEQGRYRFPTLQQIASLDFFRHIDLRELRSLMPVPSIKAKLSPAARAILKEVKRHQRSRRRSKRPQSMPALETESLLDYRDSPSSGNSSRASKRKKKHSVTSSESSKTELHGDTLLKTMPFSENEGSAFHTHPSTSTTTEYVTPPTSPKQVPKPISQENTLHTLLLQEIETGFKLKKVSKQSDPENVTINSCSLKSRRRKAQHSSLIQHI